MNTLKLKNSEGIPEGYSGIVEWDDGGVSYLKNGKLHREDGPARIYKDGYKPWWLDGNLICNSSYKFDLTNRIILSKAQHPLYPTVQVWKILNKSEVYEQIVIPGMEEFIKE